VPKEQEHIQVGWPHKGHTHQGPAACSVCMYCSLFSLFGAHLLCQLAKPRSCSTPPACQQSVPSMCLVCA
jgi:hypothetical protein